MLVIAMSVGALAGCSKSSRKSDKKNNSNSEESFFDVVSSVADYTNEGTLEFELSGSIQGVDASGKIIINYNEDAVGFGCSINASGMNIELDNVAIVTKDSMYMNVKQVLNSPLMTLLAKQTDMSQISSFLGLMPEWFKIEYSDLSQFIKDGSGDIVESVESMMSNLGKLDLSFLDKFAGDLNDSYDELITKDGDYYVLEISNKNSAYKFTKATANFLEKSGVEFFKAAINKLPSDVLKLLFESGEAVVEEKVEELVEKMIEEIKAVKEEDVEFDNGKLKIGAGKKGDTVMFKIAVDINEGGKKISGSYGISLTHNTQAIEIPDSATSVSDILALLNNFKEN